MDRRVESITPAFEAVRIAAWPIVALYDEDLLTLTGQQAGAREATDPTADDDDVVSLVTRFPMKTQSVHHQVPGIVVEQRILDQQVEKLSTVGLGGGLAGEDSR